MMNYLLPIFVIVAVATCGADKPTVVLAPDLVARLSEKATVCQIESGAEPSILGKLFPWQMEESEVNGKFLFCLMREMKFRADNDRLDVDKFMEIFDGTLQSQYKNEVRNVLAECNKEIGKNLYFTVFKMAYCFHVKTPVGMSLV